MPDVAVPTHGEVRHCEIDIGYTPAGNTPETSALVVWGGFPLTRVRGVPIARETLGKKRTEYGFF